MKFDVAGADAKICFGHNAGNVDRRSGACRAEVGAVVRVGVHAPHAAPDALTRKAALLLLRVMAVRAKRKHDSNIAIPAARRRELVQNGRQNFIARHGPGDIARNDGNLLPRFYQLPQRLCADGVRQRVSHGGPAAALVRNLIRRQDAQQVFIRDIQKLSDDLKAEVVDLQQQKETAQEELRRAKKEIQTEKLKGAATTAAANIAESVGSLFGSNKVKTLERENTALHKEVADHEETIEALQDRIQTMQADHSREIREMQQKHGREIADKDTRHKQEISFLKTVIARAAAWFPYFREMLRIENLCRLVGFDERQTATLVKGKPLEYAGELYSEEHGRKFTTERAGFQVLKDPTDGTKLVLAIDRKPIAEWFKEQFEKLRQNIRRPIQPQRKGKGFKL